MRNVLCYNQCSYLGRRKPLLSFCGFQTVFLPLSPIISSRTVQTSHSLFLGLPLKCLLEGKILWGKKNQSTQKSDHGCLEGGVREGDESFWRWWTCSVFWLWWLLYGCVVCIWWNSLNCIFQWVRCVVCKLYFNKVNLKSESLCLRLVFLKFLNIHVPLIRLKTSHCSLVT